MTRAARETRIVRRIHPDLEDSQMRALKTTSAAIDAAMIYAVLIANKSAHRRDSRSRRCDVILNRLSSHGIAIDR